MKALLLRRVALACAAVVLAVLMSGCPVHYSYTVYEPVYRSWADVRQPDAVGEAAPRTLENPGKIYVFGDLIFVSDRNAGIHVVDRRDPTSPQSISFIEVPGNLDISVLSKGENTYLYADSYVDLLVFDIDPSPDAFRATLLTRRENVFSYNPVQMFVDEEEPVWFPSWIEENGVIVDYTVRLETDRMWGGPFVRMDAISAETGAAGIAGSMARFSLYEDSAVPGDWYLYAVDQSSLAVFTLSDPGSPARQARVDVGWGIETVFEYEGNLFIGSMSAMYTYSLRDPGNPTLASEFRHWTSYDPVVVGAVGDPPADTAFVTLRSESGWGVDSLIAVDVSDLAAPTELLEVSLWNPHGLALFEVGAQARLIVADGEAGLKVFDVTRVRDESLPASSRLRQVLALDNDLGTYDLIPLGDVILVVGDDGLYLYRYAEDTTSTDAVASLSLLGSLPIG